MAEINFACCHCGQTIVADAAAAGLRAECPSCRQLLTIPGASFSQEEDDGEHWGTGEKEEEWTLGVGGPEWSFLHQQWELMVQQCERLSAQGLRTLAELKFFRADRERMRLRARTLKKEVERVQTELKAKEAMLEGLWTQVGTLEGDLEIARLQSLAALDQLEIKEKLLAGAQARRMESERHREALCEDGQEVARQATELQREIGGLQGLQEQLSDKENQLSAGRLALEAAEAGRRALAEECRGLKVRLEQSEQLPSQEIPATELAAQGERLARIQATIRDRQQEALKWQEEERKARAALERVENRLGVARQELAGTEAAVDHRNEKEAQPDAEHLRGIVQRQNGEIQWMRRELRRHRRARIALRLAYVLFASGLLGLLWGALEMIGRK